MITFGKKEKQTQEDITKQLSQIQTSVNELKTQVNTINGKIGDQETYVKNFDKQLRTGSDDQAFLGFILAFITTFLSIQYGDIAGFFKSMGSSSEFSIITFKWMSLSFFIISIVLRYYSTIFDDSKPKIFRIKIGKVNTTDVYNSYSFRHLSLEFLFIGFEFIAIVLIFNLSNLLNSFLFLISMFFLVVLCIFFFEKLEAKMLAFYMEKGFIASNSEPIAKFVFAPIAVLTMVELLLPLSLLSIYSAPIHIEALFANLSVYDPSSPILNIYNYRGVTFLCFTLCIYLFYRIRKDRPTLNTVVADYAI